MKLGYAAKIVAVNAAIVLLLFISAEVATRTYLGEWHFINFGDINLIFSDGAGAYFKYDPDTGWIVRPGFSNPSQGITVTDEGLRSNGDAPQAGGRPLLLAAGDSFTFGDQVRDGETWPAYLQVLTGHRVLNAGVSGYGLDQTLWRAESFAARDKPDAVIVSFIPDDINRMRLSVRDTMAKPYYSVRGDRLVKTAVFALGTEDFWWSRLGYSALLYQGLKKTAIFRHEEHRYRRTGENPVKIACLALRNFASSMRQSAIRFTLLVQYSGRNDFDFPATRTVIECARSDGIDVVDTRDDFLAFRDRDPAGYTALFNPPNVGHMTAAGNRFVADVLYAHLRSTGPVQPISTSNNR